MRTLRVKDLMTRPVVSVERDHSIHVAASILRFKHIRHLPVVDRAKRLVGLVTHRDLIAAQADVLARSDGDPRAFFVPVARIMKEAVWSVEPDTPAMEAARIMLDHRFGCLPVLEHQHLVGIVTEVDLLGAFVCVLEQRREREDTNPSLRLDEVRP
jgi:CBS domain-containing membrane protein